MGEYDSEELSKIVAELNRAAPSQKRTPTRGSQATPTLDKLLNLAATRNASDILLVAGAPAMLRVTGNLTPASGPPLEAEEVRSLVTPLLEPAQLDELQRALDILERRLGLVSQTAHPRCSNYNPIRGRPAGHPSEVPA